MLVNSFFKKNIKKSDGIFNHRNKQIGYFYYRERLRPTLFSLVISDILACISITLS